MEPSGTCAGHLAAVLGLRKASLLQTALQETVVVDSPGPGLRPLGGALAVQGHVMAPGTMEAAWGWQAREREGKRDRVPASMLTATQLSLIHI